MSRNRRTYDKSAKRAGAPITLDYEPLEAGELHRFLSDLVKWVLSGRIKPRQASVCRSLVLAELEIQGFAEFAAKVDEIDTLLAQAKDLLDRTKASELQTTGGSI